MLSRDEVDHKLLELRPNRFAFRYLGDLPVRMAMILRVQGGLIDLT